MTEMENVEGAASLDRWKPGFNFGPRVSGYSSNPSRNVEQTVGQRNPELSVQFCFGICV